MSQAGSGSKQDLRSQVLRRRAARPVKARAEAADRLRDQVARLSQVRAAETVAAYVSMPEEPGTGPLIEALRRGGVRVLLPVLQRDLDLDWALYVGVEDLAPGRFGIRQPSGPSLGIDALREASVVICPGVAADPAGHRLGRGGGSYDRALARLDPRVLRCVLLYDDELVDQVPHEGHDQVVGLVVTPTRVVETSGVSPRAPGSARRRPPPGPRRD